MSEFKFPTHANIDAAIHSIDRIQLFEKSAHTHRVFFNCDLKFDVRGEHQFVEHAVGAPVRPTPNEKVALEASRDARDVVEREQKALEELIEHDPGSDDEVKADRWKSLRLAQEGKLDQAQKKLARANEDYHRSRDGGASHQRWLTATGAKPVKTTCPDCLAAEVAKIELLGHAEVSQ